MKVLMFYMDGCPHCVEFEREVEKLNFKIDSHIERKHVSDMHRRKYNIRKYPTIVFIGDDRTLLQKFEGITDARTLNTLYKSFNKSHTV